MNNKQKTIALSTVLILIISVILGGIILVSGETSEEDVDVTESPVPTHRHGPGFMTMLSEEQQVELDEAIQEMREMEATQQEIREYIDNFLEENGIECDPLEVPNRPELTEEQRELFQQLMEDVQAYAQQRAEELGLELPEDGFSFGLGHHGPMRGHRFMEPQ